MTRTEPLPEHLQRILDNALDNIADNAAVIRAMIDEIHRDLDECREQLDRIEAMQ